MAVRESAFTFLHAADLHIDSPLHGLARYDGAPVERMRSATRDAFAELVEAAIERDVAFVIVAGDVFDGDWPDVGTGLWFNAQLSRLTANGIRVFLLRGNHDAESKVVKQLDLPEGVTRFRSSRPETHVLADLGVALHGQSFKDVAVQDNLARAYPAPVAGALNIGVLHTSLTGDDAHGTYAPCTREDLVSKGYDYWALGHIHRRQVVSEGSPWIVFPGNLQGRHAKETGPKGATLVTVEDGAVTAVEALALDVVRWAALEVDLSGALDRAEAKRRLWSALDRASTDADGRTVAARVTFVGATPLDGALRAGAVLWEAEVRSAAIASEGDLWIEKVKLATTAPNVLERPGVDPGSYDLAERVRQAEFTDEELEVLVRRHFEPLAQKLPQRALEAYDPTDVATLRAAVDPARRLLAALLTGARSTDLAAADEPGDDAEDAAR